MVQLSIITSRQNTVRFHPLISIKCIVVFPHDTFNPVICIFRNFKRILDLSQAFLLVRFVEITSFVLHVSVVLNFLAFVFDFGIAQGSRGSFQKMAQRRECRQVFFIPGSETIND